jgi:TolA-binding protein
MKNFSSITRVLPLAMAMSVAVGIGACADMGKTSSYPNEVTSISKSKSELKSVMYQMGVRLGNLESMIATGGLKNPEMKEDIIQELESLKKIAQSIRDGKVVTKHRQIDEHINEFIADVEHAKLAAASDSPNYYYAGKLAGSCTACHLLRSQE